MSEKQVNIKITANTKDFNSAIDKAKREIEGLAEALEKLSANKIGEKIEEQFSNLSKVIKELEDKINAIVGSFDKLDKAKLDKAEDGLCRNHKGRQTGRVRREPGCVGIRLGRNRIGGEAYGTKRIGRKAAGSTGCVL